MNTGTKDHSKRCTHTHSAKKAENLIQRCRPAGKPLAAVLCQEEQSSKCGIHVTKDHNNVRRVLLNTGKTTKHHSEENAWNADIQCTRSASPWQCTSARRCSRSSTVGAFQLGVV
jgi:hypothetical protein